MKTVTFDFDGTLLTEEGMPSPHFISSMRSLAQTYRINIVTTRNPEHEKEEWWSVHEPNRVVIQKFVEVFGLPVQKIFYTNHAPKSSVINLDPSIVMHFDNDIEEAITIRKDCVFIHASPEPQFILFDLNSVTSENREFAAKCDKVLCELARESREHPERVVVLLTLLVQVFIGGLILLTQSLSYDARLKVLVDAQMYLYNLLRTLRRFLEQS